MTTCFRIPAGKSRIACSTAFAFALCLILNLPALAQKKPVKQEPQIGEIAIDQTRDLILIPEQGYFKSPGKVRIILTDTRTGEKITLIADDAEGRANGEIVVHGAVRLERREGTLTGRSLNFNSDSETGSILHARVEMGSLSLTGERVDILPGRVIKATSAYFTTCIRGRPDYHITAKSIEASPAGKVKARNVTLWLGRTRIISLPSMERNFKGSSGSPIPLPGYSTNSGLHFRFHDEPIASSSMLLGYDIQLSLKRSPDGAVTFEKDLGHADEERTPPRAGIRATKEPLRTALESDPALLHEPGEIHATGRRTTLFANVTANRFIYNRTRTDLRVSRYPEVGLAFQNVFNRTGSYDDPNQVQGKIPSVFGAGFFSPASWLVNSELSAGYFRESPTRQQTGRIALRTDAASPLFQIANPLFLRYGGTFWANAYGTGAHYLLFAPEAELDLLIGKKSILGAAYRVELSEGKTPFIFDGRDVRHEMRLRYGYLGGDWGYDLSVHYDLERKRAYDTVVSVRRRLDCMEFGLAYRTRGAGLTLLMNFVPPKK